MSGSNVKFTKRLSVRLAAISSLVVLAGIAIAQGQLRQRSAAPQEPPQQPLADQTAVVQPIPLPEGEETAVAGRQELLSEPPSPVADWPDSPPQRPDPDASPTAAGDSSSALIIRGKQEEPVPPSEPLGQPDSGFASSATELPAAPAFDRGSVYSAPAGAAAAAESGPPASAFAPPGDLPATPPAELDSSLRDAARAAIAPTPPPANRPAQPASSGWGDAPAVAPASAQQDPADFDPPQAPADFSPPQAPLEPQGFAPPSQLGPAAAPSPYGLAAPQFDAPAAAQEPAGFPQTSSSAPMSAAADLQPVAGVAGFEGDGRPGGEPLDGRQAPALTIEKVAPAEIQVGKEAAFEVRIRNVGQVAAHDLIVLDRVPRGTRFVSAQPQATQAPDGQLMWQLGTLEPGEESKVTLNVLPVAEGEIGSVAQVLFQTHASARSVCTKPELAVKHTGPAKVLIGEAVVLDITVSNPGTGAATGIVLVEDLPPGLSHAAGKELEYAVGTLQPGESRQLQLTLKADQGGLVQNSLLVRGDGNLIARDTLSLEVVAPALEVSLSGPRLRYLEREATYEVAVANPGTAAARGVELVTYLPKGMKFVAADHKGHYEPQNHAVYWSVEELPPQETGVAKLTLLPLEPGEQKLSLEGRAGLGLKHSAEKLVQVDSLAELQFSVTDQQDPIEIGSETTYVIDLSNRGSSAASQIQLLIGLPPELKPIGGEGPTKVVIEGPQMSIEPLAHLGPGEQVQYKLRVRGVGAGHQRLQVQLVTAEAPVPLTKEELTRVYADQ